jgi:hypothetical protein
MERDMTERCESERDQGDSAPTDGSLWAMTATGSSISIPEGHIVGCNIEPVAVNGVVLWVAQVVYLHAGQWPSTFTLGATQEHLAAVGAMGEFYNGRDLNLMGREEWFESTRDYLLAFPSHHATRGK